MILSVVIATYRMQREAPRTLRSSLTPLQREVEGIDYEVIVIDNGSPTPLDLDAEISTNLPVRLIRIDPSDAQVSPVYCINSVVERHASGDFLLICIDGARMLSSHLIRRTIDALSLFPDSFTFVGSRHLGRMKQMAAIAEGYDQKAEDELLQSVDWMSNLDALWEISVWASAHDQNNFLWQNESNAFGLSRNLWRSLGGFHPGFQRPGGGLSNLEFFERAVGRENALNILLHGESTFHQFHGGAATASTDYFAESRAEYSEITGREYQRPRYDFLADLGGPYRRLQVVGGYLCD
jgi:hypothetical protein